MANQQYDPEVLSENIFRFRREKGLTREVFAELTGVSSRMVYDWENGISYPNIKRLVTIAMVLGVTLDSMFTAM